MVTYFNKKDLVKFGNYLLSEERKKRILTLKEEQEDRTDEERLRNVYHADIENFLSESKDIK